jgi:hypothetical protein
MIHPTGPVPNTSRIVTPTYLPKGSSAIMGGTSRRWQIDAPAPTPIAAIRPAADAFWFPP